MTRAMTNRPTVVHIVTRVTIQGSVSRGVARFSQELFEFEWRFYAMSAAKAIFRARTYNRINYSVR